MSSAVIRWVCSAIAVSLAAALFLLANRNSYLVPTEDLTAVSLLGSHPTNDFCRWRRLGVSLLISAGDRHIRDRLPVRRMACRCSRALSVHRFQRPSFLSAYRCKFQSALSPQISLSRRVICRENAWSDREQAWGAAHYGRRQKGQNAVSIADTVPPVCIAFTLWSAFCIV